MDVIYLKMSYDLHQNIQAVIYVFVIYVKFAFWLACGVQIRALRHTFTELFYVNIFFVR
jgi:hypothetical protein